VAARSNLSRSETIVLSDRDLWFRHAERSLAASRESQHSNY